LVYRDFFDHHGFLPYYFLSLFSSDKTFLSLKLIFLLIQSLNLILFLIILKKNKLTKSHFLIFGFLYIILTYFFADQTLWYENFILLFYLAIYLLFIYYKKNKKTDLLLGILIAICSFIKPTAAIIILPLFFYLKDFLIMIGFLISWLAVLIFFFSQNALNQVIKNLFLFNFFISKNYPKEQIFDLSFILVIFLLLIFALLIIYKTNNKADQTNRIVLLLFFLISSLIFPILKYARFHLIVFVPFFLLTLAKASQEKSQLSKFFKFFILIFLIFICFKTYKQYFFNQKREVWQDNKIVKEKIMTDLKKINIEKKKILIVGDHAEIYFYLNKKPLTYFPLVFNFVPEFYKEFFYEDYYKAISKAEILLVFKDNYLQKKLLTQNKIKILINKQFKKLEEKNEYEIYIKN
ncbi:MAG: hypothetical protein ACPL3E_01885, partial [Minisyncoccia bacterium]